ncbi:hypothetical protein T03_7293 [Trichinella britovi]|uniref:Uncharacterized protein n=1 Tax=Trichinella britovi TaxID=45882 RepID=A0A0V1CJP1_TRIBR|nr:hypothetical protein T03_7293 [Trichinella britovi]
MTLYNCHLQGMLDMETDIYQMLAISSTIESYAMKEKSLSNVDDLNIEITKESYEGQANGVRQPYGIFNDKG